MSAQKTKRGQRKTKMEILQIINDYIKESNKVVFNRSGLREPPWNINPRTAEEFLRIIYFCQQMPKIKIIQDNRNFVVQVLLPATYVTKKEALEVLELRQIDEEKLSRPPWREQLDTEAQEMHALEGQPKFASPEAYWGRSRVFPQFVCDNCEIAKDFQWHCFEPMDLEEDNILKCWRCQTTQEIPKCEVCQNDMKLRFLK